MRKKHEKAKEHMGKLEYLKVIPPWATDRKKDFFRFDLPPKDDQWQHLAMYLLWLDRTIREVREAGVSLERKVHFHQPSQPVLRKKNVFGVKLASQPGGQEDDQQESDATETDADFWNDNTSDTEGGGEEGGGDDWGLDPEPPE